METDNLRETAKFRLLEFEALISKVEEKLKNETQRQIWTCKHSNTYQFYSVYRDPKTGTIKRHYIKRIKKSELRHSLQVEYLFKALPLLKRCVKALKSFISSYDCKAFINLYDKMPQSKKEIVTPLMYDDKTFIEKWQNQIYERKPVQINTFITIKKEAVRSKSEHIIANTLYHNEVPYHYELPLKFKNGLVIYPDFYCLNKRTRQAFYWEHFGMMTDRQYANDFVQRLSQYSQNNIFPGKNLIITTESENHPLNTSDVERLINTFLK